MMKQQNSSGAWARIKWSILIVVALFTYTSFIFTSTVGAQDTPVSTIPEVAAAQTEANAGDLKTVEDSCKNQTGAAAQACKKGYENALEGKGIDASCTAFEAEKATACKIGAAFGFGAKAKGAKPDSTKPASNPDCDVQLSSPLSWIICPVVDLGANFTDFVFTTFVRGLLETVPIEAKAGNGSFEAWKQFRTLGNIVLLGTLIAVVYSQARNK